MRGDAKEENANDKRQALEWNENGCEANAHLKVLIAFVTNEWHFLPYAGLDVSHENNQRTRQNVQETGSHAVIILNRTNDCHH